MSFGRWNLCLLMLMISQVHSAINVVCAVNESVKLKKPESSSQSYSEVTWFYNETQKILIWNNGEEPLKLLTNLKDRISLDNDKISLRIQNLQKEDSSTYKVQTSLESTSQVFSDYIRLDVYERLTQPKITSDPKRNADGTCVINMTCSVEQDKENVTYEWTPVELGANASTRESILSITWKPGNHDQYTCTVRNPVSNSSHTVLASDLCAGKTSRVSQELLVVILPSIFSFLFTLNWTQ